MRGGKKRILLAGFCVFFFSLNTSSVDGVRLAEYDLYGSFVFHRPKDEEGNATNEQMDNLIGMWRA